jgi:uncharacterized protein (TIGR00369 family)
MNNDEAVGKNDNADMHLFFQDEEFTIKYPGVKVPPPCFIASGAKIISHEPNKSLTISFPIREDQTNPVGSLQGGILGSFFDDTFGPLAFKTTQKPCVSIDMTVNFIRQVRPGEIVTIKAEFKSKGRTLLQLYGEAYNDKNKLIATATSNMLIYERQ